jgi:hypothetical protein
MAFAINAPSLFNLNTPQPNTPAPANYADLALKLASMRVDPMSLFVKSAMDRMQAEPDAQFRRSLFEKATGENLPEQGGLSRTLFGTQAPSLDALKTYSSILEDRSQKSLREQQIEELKNKAGNRDELMDFRKQLVDAINQESNPEAGGLDSEDYYTEPVLRNVMGTPVQINKKTLKPKPTQQALDDINQLRTLSNSYIENINLMTPNVKAMMVPGDIRASKNSIGNFILKGQSLAGDKQAQEFQVFKAETNKLFDSYRKWVTGAQAALKELGWISPQLPETNDAPDVFINKSKVALERYKQAEELMLKSYSQAGYRTGELRSGSPFKSEKFQNFLSGSNQNIVKTGTEKSTGRKIGITDTGEKVYL